MPEVELIVRGGEGEVAAAAKALGLEAANAVTLPPGPRSADDPDTGIVRVTVADDAPPALFELARTLERATGREVEPALESSIFRPWPTVAAEAPDRGEAGNRWAVEAIGCPDAWKRSTGAGVKVGHPDTGYVDHPELAGAIAGGYDVYADDDDPRDVLEGGRLGQFPGHGTGTASVIASREEDGTDLVGSAPGVTVVPFRVSRSVVLFGPSRLLRAVRLARRAGCDAISISLGGLFLGSALRDELNAAAAEGLIVVAAAGQPVPFVVEPASYGSTIGVAGSTIERKQWWLSGRGKSVDLSAPAVDVPRAEAESGGVAGGDGTSFATALTAGVAAAWLAHNREELAGEPAATVGRFRASVAETVTTPGGWDEDFGPGILDAAALLESAPAAAAASREPAPPSRGKKIIRWISRLVETEITPWLEATFEGTPEQAAQEFGTELAFIAAHDEEARREVSESAVRAAADLAAERQRPAPERVRRSSSPSLRQRLDEA